MKKAIILFSIGVLSLIIIPFTFANESELSDREIVERSDRLDAINEKLQQPMSDRERANMLFEKSQLMFNTFGPIYLRTATESLLKAIELNPNEYAYKEFLSEIYNFYWENRDFSGDDRISRDLVALKEKCKAILRGYSICAAEQRNPAGWDSQDSELFQEIKAKHKLDDAQAYEMLGMAFLRRDFWEKASMCFEKATQLNPALYLSWYHLGLINMDNPEKFFKKAMEANPEFPLSYYWLAMYYQQNDRQIEAVKFFKKYLQVVNRNDPQEKNRIKVAEDAVKE